VTHGLAGRAIVVTRAAEQASTLVQRLAALGATVVEVPTIAIADPPDGGAALRAAVGRLGPQDWVVVTSANGARRLAEAVGAGASLPTVRLVAVGPGTAAALAEAGLSASLVPERFVAEGVLEAFPPPSAGGRVLLAQAAGARAVLADGLRAAGWEVETVVAYTTVPATPAPEIVAAARGADAITFTSASTVRGWLSVAAVADTPPVVACIGPVTAAAAADAGLSVTTVAAEHTIDGLIAALVAALPSA
jgi:uroporphyrinogen-III synthase